MSSFLSSLWPVRANIDTTNPSIFRMDVGFEDWPEQIVTEEHQITQHHREPWLALARKYPPRAKSIQAALRKVQLVPEAVTHVLSSLFVIFGGNSDARKWTKFGAAALRRATRRVRQYCRLLEELEGCALPQTPTVPIQCEVKTTGQPLHEPLVKALRDALQMDLSIMKALESDPPIVDVGRFLEITEMRLGLDSLELACVLQQHPTALSALRRRGASEQMPVFRIHAWIRKMVARSKSRPVRTRP